MPVILRLNGFKFFFYSNEGNPREPALICKKIAFKNYVDLNLRYFFPCINCK